MKIGLDNPIGQSNSLKKMSLPPSSPAKAFTLVELLATIAIVGILAALIVPGISRATESSRQVKCTQNLKQIGAALFSYAAENNASLPAVATQWGPASTKDLWGFAIWTYAGYAEEAFREPEFNLGVRPGAKGDNIFRCPSTRAKSIQVPSASPPNGNFLSYGLNSGPAGDSTDAWTKQIRLTLVKEPSKTAMVTECSYGLGSISGYLRWYGLIPHTGGSTILFYDGHAEYRKLKDIPATATTVNGVDGGKFWNGN